jgi:hypothetical protein
MYRNVGRLSEQIPNYRVRPIYPREFPIHWGVYECASSVLLIGLSLLVVAGIAALVLLVIGFDSLTELYSFNQTIGRFEVLSLLKPG